MEYQQKKEQILSSVEFTNLLSFNLVENKLERNFKSIVQALMLNQGRTEEIGNRTEQIQDRLALERQKNQQDQESLRHAIKQLNERMNRLETNPVVMGQNVIAPLKEGSKRDLKDPSKQQLKDIGKLQSSKKQIFFNDNVHTGDKGSAADKKMEDLIHQISQLKQKMPGLQLLEHEFDNMKRDISSLKGELMTLRDRSSKAIKRESIANQVQMNRRDSSAKLGRSSIINQGSLSPVLNDIDNKENKSSIDGKDLVGRVDTNISQLDGQLEKELQGIHVEVNTLHLCFEELKAWMEDLRKKDIKSHSTLAELQDRQKRMQDEMRKDTQNFEKQIKNIQLNLINTESEHSSSQKVVQTKQPTNKRNYNNNNNNSSSQQAGVNYKNQLNDKLSKIQASLQGFVSESEFNRFKNETRGKTEELEKKHEKVVNQYEEEIKKIYDMFINKDLDITRLAEQLAATGENIKENSAQADRKHNIAIARVEELKKNLQNLREDVEFYQSLNADNNKKAAQGQKKTCEGDASSSQNKESKEKSGLDPRALEDLKKYFNNKLHDQRAYLVGLVRDLEKKQQAANGVSQQIANIWDKINEYNLFLSKKADAQDTKKNLIYLEKKISRLGAHLMKGDDSTQDALVARKNWFCLSCDKSLVDYQGKVGKHVVWDTMPLKGLVKTVDKRSLPSLKIK